MALPDGFVDVECYFEDCLVFLKGHQWLYNFSNTEIIVLDVLNNIPDCWEVYLNNITSEQFNSLLLGDFQVNCPETLRIFIKTIKRLTPLYDYRNNFSNNNTRKINKITDKKLHEINTLCPIIAEECKKCCVDCVVDIGSGLGCLSVALNKNHNLTVLGIETDENRVKEASKRTSNVTYINHHLTKHSTDFIKSQTSKFGANFALVGLHACADLTPVMLELFTRLEESKVLILMPCCYHRMKILDDTCGDVFENFPMSRKLKDLFERYEGGKFLRRYFLRLSCQHSFKEYLESDGDKRRNTARNLLYRCVLEKCANDANCKITRQTRKSGSTSAFIADRIARTADTHHLTHADGSRMDGDTLKAALHDKWDEYNGRLLTVERFVGFQAAVQCLCENLVLLDRVEFLREMGIVCRVTKVTDEKLSPRCYALVARKGMD